MKKLFFIILTVVFVGFSVIVKEYSDINKELVNAVSERVGTARADKTLTKRCRNIEKLFNETKYPITEKMFYFYFEPNASINPNTAGMSIGETIIVFNPKYEITDSTIIHELCHATLDNHNIASINHDSPEWNELISYFESLGYTDLGGDGYFYEAKLAN